MSLEAVYSVVVVLALLVAIATIIPALALPETAPWPSWLRWGLALALVLSAVAVVLLLAGDALAQPWARA